MYKLLLTAILFSSLTFKGLSQTSSTYTITFENYDQFEIKKIIGLMNPVFNASVSMESSFLILSYVSEENVTEEELKKLLLENGYKFISFKREENED
ncbi:MAG: hypothetical protein R3277_00520 [Brumimicrobium sp.]|nr:hypothetical protein [Brumimicrobium sp.]